MHHGIRVEMPGEEGREEKSAQVCAGLHVQVASADTARNSSPRPKNRQLDASRQCIVPLAL